LVLGFGVPLVLAFLVPVVAVPLMPGAVAGATLLGRELAPGPPAGSEPDARPDQDPDGSWPGDAVA
jgi:CysZ protein